MLGKKPGQISENPCERSRGQIFCLMLMKLCQNVCLNEISDALRMGHVWSKTS